MFSRCQSKLLIISDACTYTHAHTHTKTYTRTHTHKRTNLHTHTHAHTHKRAHTHKHTHTHDDAGSSASVMARNKKMILALDSMRDMERGGRRGRERIEEIGMGGEREREREGEREGESRRERGR